jgi:hypothetical protein
MSEEDTISRKIHEKLAKNLFNLTWSLLDKGDRTEDDDLKMIHAAHASRHHWGEIGEPLQFERGEWQISRVYSVLGRSEPALFHAEKCLKICEENGIADFDIAFAYEAMARAYALAGDEANLGKYLAMAKKAADNIEDKGNKDYFLGELKSINR